MVMSAPDSGYGAPASGVAVAAPPPGYYGVPYGSAVVVTGPGSSSVSTSTTTRLPGGGTVITNNNNNNNSGVAAAYATVPTYVYGASGAVDGAPAMVYMAQQPQYYDQGHAKF